MDLVTKQREERRQRILDVARRLIAERGFAGVTMRELADESLVSVPTLYNLFGGKTELLFASVESYFLQLLESADRSGSEVGLDKVLSVFNTLGTQMLKHAAYARSLMGFFAGGGESLLLREFVARELTNQLVEALGYMQSKRQLAAWVNVEALGERITTHMIMTAFEWASGHVADGTLPSAMIFGGCSMIFGFAKGKTATTLEELLREHQDASLVPRAAAGSKRPPLAATEE